jgi:hypothetical protein
VVLWSLFVQGASFLCLYVVHFHVLGRVYGHVSRVGLGHIHVFFVLGFFVRNSVRFDFVDSGRCSESDFGWVRCYIAFLVCCRTLLNGH